MHVFEPPARYPLARDRAYTPPEASVEELVAFQERLRFERVVIVQPSVYGSDNSCLLDALRRLGPRARGVAVIDSQTPGDDLEIMQRTGVRGVRVNLQTGGRDDPAFIEEAATRAAPLGWHVQVFARVSVLRRFKPLAVPLVVDHFGLPGTGDEVRYLAHLVNRQQVYVKLSAAHRLAIDPGPVVRALLEANPSAACGAATGRIPAVVGATRVRSSPSIRSTMSPPWRGCTAGWAIRRCFAKSSSTIRLAFTISE